MESTYYTIGIEKGDENLLGNILDKLFEISEDAQILLDNDGTPKFDGDWRSCDEEIQEVSRLFPDVVISLHQEGEQRDDCSNTYYKDGKIQFCPIIISFDPFNESELS